MDAKTLQHWNNQLELSIKTDDDELYATAWHKVVDGIQKLAQCDKGTACKIMTSQRFYNLMTRTII